MFLRNFFIKSTIKLRQIDIITGRCFSEIIKHEDVKPVIIPKSAGSILAEHHIREFKLSSQQVTESEKVGADFFLTYETRQTFVKTGLRFEDVNEHVNQHNLNASTGIKLSYLKNQLLLRDYDTVLREFFQATAQLNTKGLKLNLEPRFLDYFLYHIDPIKSAGYQIDIENLRIKQNYKVLRFEIYKNLKMNRFENKPFSKYSFRQDRLNPVAPVCVATELGEDKSYFVNDKPYIFAATMLVETPMSLVIFNQNRSKKLYAGSETKDNTYVVRFESEFNFSDFFWILPTQNKPARLRNTRIADFNNILRGNPFFNEKIDLLSDKARFNYMSKDDQADDKVRNILQQLNTNQGRKGYSFNV